MDQHREEPHLARLAKTQNAFTQWRLVWSRPDGMRLEIHTPGLRMEHLQAIATSFVGG
ncbi:hypothetical protein SCOR_21985 [Sulfidibacter corallicola]|uniref:Uncharacterized protein n=1 Tax=Sulfidibacter corallicola TaxID=2818388 RepID=A0A8A4TUT9_SULCO|nr:hypothetical protein [Sulfidibacter corallicola]QTD52908.1 hypothetical protein J3U87_10560 [Sulfidibacter corallicola]